MGGCTELPPLQSLEQVNQIEKTLWKNGAEEFAAEEFRHFQKTVSEAKQTLSHERAKWSLLQRYDKIQARLDNLFAEGGLLLQSVSQKRKTAQEEAVQGVESVKLVANRLREHSDRLYITRHSRKKAIQADLLLTEARYELDQGRYRSAIERAKQAGALLQPAKQEIESTYGRYFEHRNLARWKMWVRETLEWSRAHAAPVIIVRKAERTLTLYMGDRPLKTYEISLGFNGLNDKRMAGDGATPEGRYRIIMKKGTGETIYHKALLINYPNDRDRRRLKGVTKRGGLIEIHGGKDDGLEETLGCVALNNREIDDLFDRVSIGTPVTIIGTTNGLTEDHFSL
ncbi:MAG: L,D-transpeptidase family protein [Candidatus Manganitrophaceae bacterium]